MLKRLIICFAVLLPLLVAHSPAGAAAPSPVGLWQSIDSQTKQPNGWFLVSDHDGVFSAIIAKMFLKPGETNDAPCTACKDDRHNHPWLGLEIVRGMRQESDSKYGGGTILDPRDGDVYKASMTVSPDGQTLTVRGFLGFELLGQNQYWTRLPDSAYSALDPSINPNPAVNSNPAVNPKAALPPHKSEAKNPQTSAQR